MKKLISITVLLLMFVCGAKTQTIHDMPIFEGKDLVLRSEETPSFHTISISDGVKDLFTVGLSRTDSHPAKLLVDVLYRLKKQAYKLLASNSGSYGYNTNTMVTYYIFEKD